MLETILLASLAWSVQDHGQPFATYYQHVDLHQILEKRPRTLVVDPYCGPEDRPWTKDELTLLRKHGVKPVAYVSLAVVGDFQTDLYQLAKDRGLLGPQDPRWRGDYAVRFWDPAWIDALRMKLRELRDLGYAGVYVDVVDPWTSSWYVQWFHDQTGGGVDDLRRLTYDVLEKIVQSARNLGLEVYVNAGGAASDPEFAELKKRYGFKTTVENVIADDTGRLLPESEFLDNLNAVSRLGSDVYVIEYNLDLSSDEVKKRLDELFHRTLVEAVYVTSPDHDRIGVDVVPMRVGVRMPLNGVLIALLIVPLLRRFRPRCT